MELDHCPYDHSDLVVKSWSGGSMLLACPVCGAEWESHGAWEREVREPDPAKLT